MQKKQVVRYTVTAEFHKLSINPMKLFLFLKKWKDILIFTIFATVNIKTFFHPVLPALKMSLEVMLQYFQETRLFRLLITMLLVFSTKRENHNLYVFWKIWILCLCTIPVMQKFLWKPQELRRISQLCLSWVRCMKRVVMWNLILKTWNCTFQGWNSITQFSHFHNTENHK